uniref:Predicted protein n=1 Tax=Hordeum vulgare subsp. vulgare TaxID=112509 RepID=F2DTN7_HORVV|nr:predicted protein [Hordeum vulgare subsp. vulgare]
MLDYSAAYLACYAMHDSILPLKMERAGDEVERQLKAELADLLLVFIPKELYDMEQSRGKFDKSPDRLEAILGDFSNCLQNTIFMSTIQMNQ